MTAYPELVDGVATLALQAGVGDLLSDLALPAINASIIEWQRVADKLYPIMQQRDLIHDWQFTDEQIEQLNDYFYANELLVQCLNVAVVSDRQAILAGLLVPPQVADEQGA